MPGEKQKHHPRNGRAFAKSLYAVNVKRSFATCLLRLSEPKIRTDDLRVGEKLNHKKNKKITYVKLFVSLL